MKAVMTLAAVAAVIILGGRKIALSTAPRGLRNNNPGNIRETTGSLWNGQTGTDGQFAIFGAPEYGIRAMSKLLMNYQALYGIDTVRGLINRWAPPNENDTGAYVGHVAESLGVHPDQTIEVAEHLPGLVAVITRHENGVQPYSDELINTGVAMATEGYKNA